MGDGEEICGGIIAVVIILAIIYYVIMFILSILTQILLVATIVFVAYRVHSKRNEITDWIDPSIVSLPRSEIFTIVLLNLFHVAPMYNRHKYENEKYNQIENKIENLNEDLMRTSNIVGDYRRKISILETNNEDRIISASTKAEIGILLENISKETANKKRLEKELSSLYSLLKTKKDELDKLKDGARGSIIGHKKGYEEKYKEAKIAAEKEAKKAAEAAARKEKQKKEIKLLIIETKDLIQRNKLRTSDAGILFVLTAIETKLVNIDRAFERAGISYIDAKKNILELKDEIKKIGTTREKTTEKERAPQETYYDILGVDCTANQGEIKKAYKVKMMEYHSDHFEHQDYEWVKKMSKEMSQKINEAKDVLIDPEKRKEYNRKNGLC
ncbi:MAG: hypothetical protein AEth_01115 [Candidatus Argoarchaeum ethanivorans]|uniref:J domain-containing protein n=1 Tax=Candidatus Argoarchaeum ethanivorans TaxID=2608793 RepID=A0A8B3S2E4_9EURY|nr:MAG: hypothetical protein AEth_01115 [Candidatus Argoarchaeum ethanivorans]